MELLVFGHAGARVLVFPTRAGRFYDYENWGLIEAARDKIEAGWLQLFCVDSIDAESFYCRWRTPQERMQRHLAYETYIRDEVLPLTRRLNDNMCMIAHGCSMGAYHAMNFALRHPHLVGKVVAFSGRYDLTRPYGDFPDLFDGYYDENIYFNTPTHFLPNLTDPVVYEQIRRIEIIFAVGDADPFLENNYDLSSIFDYRNIEHTFTIWHGRAHKPRYWQRMSGIYL